MRRQNGVAIITVLLALGVLAVVALAVTSQGADNLARIRSEQELFLAQYAAEAGLYRGIGSVAETLPASPQEILWSQEPMPNVAAEYTVKVWGPGEVVNGFTIPADHYYLESEGVTTDDLTSPQRRRVAALIERAPSTGLDVPIFAYNSLLLDNGYTDTDDSSQGLYPAGAAPGNAHIGTNGSGGSISFGGSASVDGGVANVYVAAGGAPAGQGTIYNTTVSMTPLAQDPVTLPYASGGPSVTVNAGVQMLPPNQAYTDIVIDGAGAILYLDAGNYQFKKLEIKNGGKLIVNLGSFLNPDDRTNVYVEDLFKIDGGGIVNPGGKPEDFRFLAAGTAPVELIGDGDPGGGVDTQAYYVCYAPYSNVMVDNAGQICGALIGQDVVVKNQPAVHYDMALQGLDLFGGAGGGTTGVNLRWFHRF
ncbi:MAG: hypothetical protein HY319_31050 [Armatimonadetes bacterium]|nr:hypothetical protein [Armatimonadota bacterium]